MVITAHLGYGKYTSYKLNAKRRLRQSMMNQIEYGERFETGVVVAMGGLILASLIAVVALMRIYHPHCTASTYTYCGVEATEHH